MSEVSTTLVGRGKEQDIAHALMISLVMIVRHILRQRMAERRFPKEHQPREALLLDRSHPPFRIGVEIWRPRQGRHPWRMT